MVPIDRGAAPQLKSDEFLDLPLLIHELGPVLSLKPQEKVLHILGAGVRVPVLTLNRKSWVKRRC